jgi:hypothetical protein
MQIITPVIFNFMSTIGSFFLFKSISIGLNVLLEIDFNRSSKAEAV